MVISQCAAAMAAGNTLRKRRVSDDMATFSYSVRNPGGGVSNGTMTADSRIDALNSLRNKGMYVVDLREQETETDVSGSGFGGGFFQRVKLEEMAIFTKQLAAMIGAGISITRSLQTLAKQEKNEYFSKLLIAVKNDVAAGLPLSAALAKYPRVFNAMIISLVLAAEETGTLDTTLEQLASNLESEVALRHEISAGMRYPQIVCTAALLIVVFIMIFVIPQFKEIFESLHAPLPWMTKVVVGVAMVLKKFGILLIPLIFGLPWLLNLVHSLPGGRQMIDTVKLRLPVFGELLRKIILARTSRVFSTMLSAGVPILKSLSIVEQTSLNAIYEEGFAEIRNAVKEGRTISGPMEGKTFLFPPMVTAMVAVGEESGTLDHMLMKINHFYTREIEATVKKLTALLEPVLIGTLGVIIGFIVIAMWMPLFGVIKLIQNME
jgi:type IV pilus assembly protein PilC